MALSGSYSNTYNSGNMGVVVTWEATQSISGNYSTVVQKVYIRRIDLTYNVSSSGTSSINGSSQSFSASGVTPSSTDMLVCTHTQRVNHNSSGEANNIPLSAVWNCTGLEYQEQHISSITASTSITLDKIDNNGPTVSVETSNIKGTSFTINVTASATCDRWRYSLNNGSSWTTFSTTEAFSQSYTITGLNTGTSYTVKVEARKKLNQKTGTTSVTVSTVSNSVLDSVNDVTIDAASPKVIFSIELADSAYTHSLTIKKSSTTLVTLSGLTLVDGQNTVNLTAEQRTTILNSFPNTKSFTGTFELRTYRGSTLVGTYSAKTATVKTTSGNSAPTFPGFTYSDTNSDITALTEDNQIIVQSLSTISISAIAATAKNGATITQYSAKIGTSGVKTSTTTSISYGAVNSAVNNDIYEIAVTVSDSRGWSTTVKVNAPAIAYSRIDISSYDVERRNGAEDAITVDLEGTIKPIIVDEVNKNSLTYVGYRYQRTDQSTWSDWYEVTTGATSTDTAFEYTNGALVSLDASYSYTVEFKVEDLFTSDTSSGVIAQGIPLMSFRKQKVGINLNEPTSALDVDGVIKQNGMNILGIIGTITGGDFNNHTTAGIHLYSHTGSATNPPVTRDTTDGFLIVMNYNSNIYQLFFGLDSNGSIRSRIYTGSSWSSWRNYL